MDAREIEALSMLARGFADLKDANPELAYNVILDIISGINELSTFIFAFQPKDCLTMSLFPSYFLSNQAVRQHVNTSRGLFPHKRITRKSEMTSRGLVVIEQEEDVATTSSGSGASHVHVRHHAQAPSTTSSNKIEPPPSPRKSPIAELLYMRWLEGLKIKWPNFS